MPHRNIILMTITPLILIGALVFAVAPGCPMPKCSWLVGSADLAAGGCNSCVPDSECEDYMMVDDTPDSAPASQGLVIAVIALPESPVQVSTQLTTSLAEDSPDAPVYDPLGARIRI